MLWGDAHSSPCLCYLLSHALICCKTAPHRSSGEKKTSSIYSCASSLLGLHVQHQSVHSGETLHSKHKWKQRNKHAQYTYQTCHWNCGSSAPPLSLFLLPLSFLLFMSLSHHIRYVKVLFPCPGATYTQGKHRAVCVDDCQQWPFIICQASVLWGGKYTQWIMVVLVCRRNPTWQPAEGRDKIVYEEIVYHGHGKHCPSHMRRAMDLRLWRRGAWMGDIWELKWRHEICNSMWWGGGDDNIIIMFLLCLICSVLDPSMCVNIGVSVLKIGTECGRDYNSYQTQSCVFLVKGRNVCAASVCLEFSLHMDHRFGRLLLSQVFCFALKFPVNYSAQLLQCWKTY